MSREVMLTQAQTPLRSIQTSFTHVSSIPVTKPLSFGDWLLSRIIEYIQIDRLFQKPFFFENGFFVFDKRRIAGVPAGIIRANARAGEDASDRVTTKNIHKRRF